MYVPNDDYFVVVGLQQTNREIGKIVTLYQRELFKKIPLLGTLCTQSVNEGLRMSGTIPLLPPYYFTALTRTTVPFLHLPTENCTINFTRTITNYLHDLSISPKHCRSVKCKLIQRPDPQFPSLVKCLVNFRTSSMMNRLLNSISPGDELLCRSLGAPFPLSPAICPTVR